MATSASLLPLLLPLLSQPWLGAGADTQAVVCAGTACYSAHWGKLSAAEAQLLCSKDGGNLATVRTEEEARHIQRALAQLLQPGAPWTGKFWIGLQREKGKCLDPRLPLKGFSWVGGGEDTLYSNWYKEARHTCISKRCVSLMLDPSVSSLSSHLPKWSEGPCGNPGSPVSNIEGFVCKFSFKGMCRPLALGGPGQVNYTTPFQATSSSLEAVPFASVANVACRDGGESRQHFFLCKEKATDVFDWGISGPLCASAEYGCSFGNGGCQQECLEGEGGSFRCGCRPGFRLLDDLVTCISRDPCSSSPCRGVATCVPESLWKNYTCQCPEGYQLNATQQDCVDVDECQASPCEQECVNTPGSFHCQCWVGYEPSSPGGPACQDVDECMSPEGGLCEGYCLNMQGSFRCTCLPGRELAPDGVSCITGPTPLGPSAETPEGQNTGDRERSLGPSTTTSSPTGGPEGTSKVASTSWRLFLESNASITPTSPQSLATTGSPGIWMEYSSHHPTATTGHEESTDGDLIAQQKNDSPDWQKLLLFYILGTVAAILLLLALALGLLVYRKRRAKREEKEKKPQSAADSYSWVPERAESRAMENQYSPTPGTDC
ncbi:complement component C1q receptor [Myotis daubentonii]|uniref:complement component C1q receptor n=1 Tax=Myotis daubentonii TaxID=98922 RepID=UPI0028736EE9|nr:complement component C1q receptor [Myotis daubentonii]